MINTLWQRLRRGYRRLIERPDWERFAGSDWGERIMNVAVTDRFHAKQGRSTGRWRLHAPDDPAQTLSVYLKRHYQLPRWCGLMALLWPGGNWSPAMAEYSHLEWARSQDLPVPATVAAGEFLDPAGRLQSFLAVEELAGMLPLNEAIPLAKTRLAPLAFRRWKRGLIVELARLARALHQKRHFHKDLYLCHFYISEADTTRLPADGWRGRMVMIDLHRLGYHPWTWPIWLCKDLAQLLYSSEVDGVDDRDRVWFWKQYRGRRRTWLDRWLQLGITIKWRRYRRHNERRKQRDA